MPSRYWQSRGRLGSGRVAGKRSGLRGNNEIFDKSFGGIVSFIMTRPLCELLAADASVMIVLLRVDYYLSKHGEIAPLG